MNSKYFEYPAVLLAGGGIYMLIELLWRGYSHWSMGLCGGICFLGIYIFENKYPKQAMPVKCLFGSFFITATEFLTGCIVNLLLGWNVWDYSQMTLNLFGQVCLLYSLFWFLLSIPAFWGAKLIQKHIFSSKNSNKIIEQKETENYL